MALKSGTLGSLLQGVSQQPARISLAGQVKEQENLISDVSRGLSTRPSTTNGPSLDQADSTLEYQDLSFDGEDYVIGYKVGVLQMWTLDGTRQNIQYRNGGSPNYLSGDMQFHVVKEDEDGIKRIVLLNRNKTVRKSTTVDGRDWYVAMFHALGGQFLKTYSVRVNFSNGVQLDAEYQAPDGTTTGDAAKTSSEYIVQQLVGLLQADPNLPSGTTITRRDTDVALIHHPTLQIRIRTSDGEGGEILRSASDTVADVEDLPRFAPNGAVVKVVSSDAKADDFWLRFDAKDVVSEDGIDGFGKEGVWVEWYNPDEQRAYDLDTMPHVLLYEDGTFYMEHGPWISRPVGDEDSAPFLSIVNKKIRDVDGFESRLVLLSTSSVVMTRTNKYFDLWRGSATTTVATDPVDITSTKKDDLSLDWLVPFDRDLFIMSDPGDSQFVIRGGGINPNTVSMVLTTEFEISSGGTPPVSTGRTILFPFTQGEYSGVKEFYTNSDNAANAANSLTETQDRYILGQIKGMEVSQNFNMALFRTNGQNSRKIVWVYKYLWDDDNKLLQSSWSKWRFKERVEHIFFRDSLVYIVGETSDGVFIHHLDLNTPIGDYGYHAMLDRQESKTVGSNYVELPYSNARFQQGSGCANPGIEAIPNLTIQVNSLTHRYFFNEDVAPNGATLNCGQTVEWFLVPKQVFATDFQNNVDTSKKITIQDYVVHVDNSGEFKALGTSPYSPDWEYSDYVFPLDNDPLDPDRRILQTGPFYIPWGERADWSEITLTGTDIRPVTIHEVEWIGQILTTKGRRA